MTNVSPQTPDYKTCHGLFLCNNICISSVLLIAAHQSNKSSTHARTHKHTYTLLCTNVHTEFCTQKSLHILHTFTGTEALVYIGNLYMLGTCSSFKITSHPDL